MEAEAIEKVRDMEIETKTMLEEQRSGIINQASYERNLQASKAPQVQSKAWSNNYDCNI